MIWIVFFINIWLILIALLLTFMAIKLVQVYEALERINEHTPKYIENLNAFIVKASKDASGRA